MWNLFSTPFQYLQSFLCFFLDFSDRLASLNGSFILIFEIENITTQFGSFLSHGWSSEIWPCNFGDIILSTSFSKEFIKRNLWNRSILMLICLYIHCPENYLHGSGNKICIFMLLYIVIQSKSFFSIK